MNVNQADHSNSFSKTALWGAAHLVEKGVAVACFAPACIYGAYNGLFDRLREYARGGEQPSPLVKEFAEVQEGSKDVTTVAMTKLGIAAAPFVVEPLLTNTVTWNAVRPPFSYFHRAGLGAVGMTIVNAKFKEALKQTSQEVAPDPRAYSNPIFAMAKAIEACLKRAENAGAELNDEQKELIRQASGILAEFANLPQEKWEAWIEENGERLGAFAAISALFPEEVQEKKEESLSKWDLLLPLSALGLLGGSLGGNAIYKLWRKGEGPAKNIGVMEQWVHASVPYIFGGVAASSFKGVGALAADAAYTGYRTVFGEEEVQPPKAVNPWYDPKLAQDLSKTTKALDAAFVATKLASMGAQTVLNIASPVFLFGVLGGAMPGLSNMLMGSERPTLEDSVQGLENHLQGNDWEHAEAYLGQVEQLAFADREKLVDEVPPSPLEMERRQFHDLPTKAKLKDLGLLAAKETGNVAFSWILPNKFPSFGMFRSLPGIGVGQELGQVIGEITPKSVDKMAGIAEKWIPLDREGIKTVAYTGMHLSLLGYMAYRTGFAGKVLGLFT